MHRYLRAVGLKSLDSKRKVREFLQKVIDNPDTVRISQDGPDGNLAVLTKKLSKWSGITVCGEYNENQEFRIDSYYPYVTSDLMSTYTSCTVMRQTDADSYYGMCEDYRLGVSLIFFLVNFMSLHDARGNRRRISDVCISGLSDEGKILLPVRKTEGEKDEAKLASVKRGHMIEEARGGNAEAMETLTIEEMNLYNMVNRRIAREDLYSVVDSFFMPNGLECYQYALMGDITEMETWKNEETGEEGYYLMVETNDMPVLISIQKDDLLGEPAEGRRFKGNVWIQGTANYV